VSGRAFEIDFHYLLLLLCNLVDSGLRLIRESFREFLKSSPFSAKRNGAFFSTLASRPPGNGFSRSLGWTSEYRDLDFEFENSASGFLPPEAAENPMRSLDRKR
jgi:hypothetical protein